MMRVVQLYFHRCVTFGLFLLLHALSYYVSSFFFLLTPSNLLTPLHTVSIFPLALFLLLFLLLFTFSVYYVSPRRISHCMIRFSCSLFSYVLTLVAFH
ncbi:hypothetical protein K474DRAFT_1077592 [Panus rudis PR-1116 ss-1]|nr:hypothetical protein K474DRAFT_1077592 [Panus rudis PR-1116 ss-1]